MFYDINGSPSCGEHLMVMSEAWGYTALCGWQYWVVLGFAGHFCSNHFGHMLSHCQLYLVRGRFLSTPTYVITLWFDRDPPELAKMNGVVLQGM